MSDTPLVHASDSLTTYFQHLATLGPRHPRRIGLLLVQLGMLITVGFACISMAGMNVGLVTAAIGAVLAVVPIHRCIGFWLGLAMLIWMQLSLLVNGNFIASEVREGFLWFGLLWMQLACHQAAPGAGRMRTWLMRLLVMSVCVGGGLGLLQFCIGSGTAKPFRLDPDGPRFWRGTGFFGRHQTQGALMGICFFLFQALTAWVGMRWIWVGRVVSGVAFAVNGARASLVGMVAAMTGFIAARGRRHLLIAVGVAIVLVAISGTVLYLTQPKRFATMVAMQDGRWPIWHTSWHLVSEHPFFGVGGSQTFQTAYAQVYPQVEPGIPNEFPKGAPHAHNIVLAHAAEFGVPFAVLWLALVGLCLWRLRGAERRVWCAGVGIVILALVIGQFDKLSGEISRFLWLSLGLLLATRSQAPVLAPADRSGA